jgi:HEAT repeat protein
MERRTRKTIAIMVAGAGIAVLTATAATQWKAAFEWWHLRALEDPEASDDERAAAAESLGAVGSARSIPRLMRRLDVALTDLKRGRLEALVARIQAGRLDPPFVNRSEGNELRIADCERRIAELDRQIAARMEGDVFYRAIVAIAGRESAGAVPALVHELDTGDWQSAWSAARLLGDLGPGAAGAVPRLEEALSDESSIVRDAAAAAIEKIRGEKAHTPAADGEK